MYRIFFQSPPKCLAVLSPLLTRDPLMLLNAAITRRRSWAHIAQVERDLQVAPEMVREFRVHVQHLQNILSVDLVQVTVGQRSHVGVGLPRARVQVNGLTKYIVLPCGKGGMEGQQHSAFIEDIYRLNSCKSLQKCLLGFNVNIYYICHI